GLGRHPEGRLVLLERDPLEMAPGDSVGTHDGRGVVAHAEAARLVVVLAPKVGERDGNLFPLRAVEPEGVPARLAVAAVLVRLPRDGAAKVGCRHLLHLPEVAALEVGGNGKRRAGGQRQEEEGQRLHFSPERNSIRSRKSWRVSFSTSLSGMIDTFEACRSSMVTFLTFVCFPCASMRMISPVGDGSSSRMRPSTTSPLVVRIFQWTNIGAISRLGSRIDSA